MEWSFEIPEDLLGIISVKLDPNKGHRYGGGVLTIIDAVERDLVESLLPNLDKKALEKEKARALIELDDAAEVARLRYLTPGCGQALVYRNKASEVNRYKDDANPLKANYPFLAAEIGITAASLKGVFEVVSAALATWETVAPKIEMVRLKAKSDIAKAETLRAVRKVREGVLWP